MDMAVRVSYDHCCLIIVDVWWRLRQCCIWFDSSIVGGALQSVMGVVGETVDASWPQGSDSGRAVATISSCHAALTLAEWHCFTGLLHAQGGWLFQERCLGPLCCLSAYYKDVVVSMRACCKGSASL
eukprot:15439872-Alexandrium_andersonii.AAC.1